MTAKDLVFGAAKIICSSNVQKAHKDFNITKKLQFMG
jgi:hypothetical protein